MARRAKGAIRASASDRVFNIINVFGMVIIAFITLYPFWYCVVLSLNDGVDAMKGMLYFWPRKFTLDNYRFIMTNNVIMRAAANSALRTIIGTVASVAFTGMVAYGLSKREIMFRKQYMLFFTFTMYFSGGMIPTYLLIKSLGLLNNFMVYIIPGLFTFFNAILFIAYYDSIPAALEESARIDGANSFTIFVRIIIPSSLPIFATIALFNGVVQWNSWFDTMIYTSGDKLITLQSIMARMIQQADAIKETNKMMAAAGMVPSVHQTVQPITIRVAAMVFTTFPITIAYPFLQKYFVKGMMIGAVKG